MATLSSFQRITKLWTAALNLEAAAQNALPHLPPNERKMLERELKRFNGMRKILLRSK